MAVLPHVLRIPQGAVVAAENDERILGEARPGQRGEHLSHGVVHLPDQSAYRFPALLPRNCSVGSQGVCGAVKAR